MWQFIIHIKTNSQRIKYDLNKYNEVVCDNKKVGKISSFR